MRLRLGSISRQHTKCVSHHLCSTREQEILFVEAYVGRASADIRAFSGMG
jgi:hypothetical protein